MLREYALHDNTAGGQQDVSSATDCISFSGLEVTVLVVRGQYEEVLHRLFRRTDDGHVRLGAALSVQVVPDLSALTSWTDFRDYVMEGSVRYAIRVREVEDGVAIDVRLTGTNRNQSIAASLKSYIRSTGFNTEAIE